MAFSLVADLKLKGPSNLNQIVNQINSKLKSVQGLGGSLNLNANQVRQLSNVSRSLTTVGKSAQFARGSIEDLGRNAALSIRRFAGFTIFASTFYTLTRAIKSSLHEAIDFQRELVKIRQVTGTSTRDLGGLVDEVTNLSTSFGVSSKKILNVAQTLAQAGFSADETKKALQALAKTEVAPTFDNIESTTEGAIAAMAQFKIKVDDLESSLGSMNAVAAKFAVESSDIITAIKRSGSTFAAAGDDLNKLIAIFTSVRATTRESAETIATGLRTIGTRLQRTRTIEFLENLGISLRDSKGQFIGVYESARKLNTALEGLSNTDPRFAQIIEELGGFRQVNKVIPLIKEFSKAEQALIVAQRGSNSLAKDAESAQEALAVQITRVKEEFQALLRTFANNEGFNQLTKLALTFSSALIKLTASLEPIAPLLATIGGFAAAKAIPRFLSGASPLLPFGKHASGGYIGGSGNSDNVPSLLTPGEYVLNKKAVGRIGRNTLDRMNSNKVSRFASGGLVGAASTGANIGQFAGLALTLAPVISGYVKLNKELDDIVKVAGQLGGVFTGLVVSGKTLNKLMGIEQPDFGQLRQNRDSLLEERKGTLEELKKSLKSRKSEAFTAADRKNQAGDAQRRLTQEGAIRRVEIAKNERLAEREAKIQSRLSVSGNADELAKGLPALNNKRKQAYQQYYEAAQIDYRLLQERKKRGSELREAISRQGRAINNPNVAQDTKDFLAPQLAKNRKELKNLVSASDNARASKIAARDKLDSVNKQFSDTKSAITSGRLQQRYEERARANRGNLDALESLVKVTAAQSAEANKALKLGKDEQSQIRDKLKKEKEAIRSAERNIKVQEALSTTASYVSVSLAAINAGLISYGSLLERQATTQLKLGNKSGVEGLGYAKATSGAGVGGGVGGTIGSAIGGLLGFAIGKNPLAASAGATIGQGIGTGVGAGVGGALGFSSGKEEGQRILDKSTFEKQFKPFLSSVTNVGAGTATAASQIGTISLGTKALRNRLRSTSGEDKETVQGQIGQVVVGLDSFIKEMLKGKDSFEELEKVVGTDLLESFASFSEIPFSKLEKQLREQIKDNTKKKSQDGAIRIEEARQLKILRSFNSLSSALNDTVDSLKRFENRTDEIVGLFGGSIARTSVSDTSGVFGRAEGTIDRELLSSAVRGTTSAFGGRADDIGKEFLQASAVLNKLPDIILTATAKPFTEADDLVDEFKNVLKTSFPGISDNIVSALSANLNKIKGDESKDTKIITEARRNPTGLSKQLSEGVLNSFSNFFETNSRLLTQHINDLGGLYEKRRNLESQMIDSLQSEIDLREQKFEFGFTSKNKAVPLDRSFDRDRLTGLIGGLGVKGTPEDIGLTLEATRRDILKKTIDLEKAEFSSRESLLKSIEDEKSNVEKLTRGLKYFTDVTARNANLQRELERIQKNNTARKDFTEEFTFGDSDTRRDLGRSAKAASILGKTGDINSIPSSLRGSALSFLKRFEDTDIPEIKNFLGGKTGGDVIKNVNAKELEGLGISRRRAAEISGKISTSPEKALIDAINTNFENAKSAQSILTNTLKDGTNKILADIEVNTKNFTTLLSKNLLISDKTDLETKATELNSKITSGKGNFDTLTKIGGLTGGVNASNFSTLRGVIPQIASLKTLQEENALQSKSFSPLSGILDKNSKLSRGFFGETRAGDTINKQINNLSQIAGLGSASVDDASKINDIISGSDIGKSQEFIAKKFGNNVRQQIFNEDFDKSFSAGKTTRGQFADILENRVTSITSQNASKRGELVANSSDIASKLGLKNVGQLSPLFANIEKLSGLFNSLPPDANFNGIVSASTEANILAVDLAKLNAEISNLTTKIGGLKPRGYASGGIVGSTDTVPAMLTPGEFVVNRSAAQSIGYGNLNRMNRFNRGGMVGYASGGTVTSGGGISPAIIDSMARFADNINRLSSSLDNFPRMVEMNCRHTVEIIHNGAQMFSALTPMVISLVEQTTATAVNSMLKRKFPEVGTMQ